MAGAFRVLGLDYGQRRIGVAVSDASGLIAQPLTTLPNRKNRVIPALQELVSAYQVNHIVVGLPRHMNGQEGEKAEEARAFGTQVQQQTGLAVDYIDERLTTLAAQRVLRETNLSGSKQRQVVDKMAAALILQTWLDQQKR